MAEQRVLAFFKRLENGKEDWIDVHRYPNIHGTLAHIRKQLPTNPAYSLSRGRFLMRRTQRFRHAVTTLIRRHRKRCNLWFKYTRWAVLEHLQQQFEIEYDLGLRSGPSQSRAKAEASIYEMFPTIARMSLDK